jgi:hypothetical protein
MVRPIGTITCSNSTGNGCRKAAHVTVTIHFLNRQNNSYREITRLLCWHHYLELEENARHSSDVEVHSAQVYERA